MFRKIVVLAVVLSAFIAGCGSVSATDASGNQVQLSSPAKRIVSLAPSNTEILFAIGAGPQMVGRDSVSDYPEEAKKVTDIGGGFGDLNMEAILAANPDLVLVAPITPDQQVADLKKAGLTVFMVPNPKSFDDLYINLETVAQLTGHEKETADLVTSLRARVQAVEEKIAPLNSRPLVFYEIDGTDPNAPWTSGPGTFVNLVIEKAGGTNLGADLKGEWVQISVEELISRDPTMILLGDSVFGGVTPEIVKARTGWGALTAVQEGRIYPFDDNLVSRPGPRLVNGLEAMAKLLHPGVFQ
jgi:iron complex transport system substrate-binding protein